MARFTYAAVASLVLLILAGVLQGEKPGLLFTGKELARPPETGKEWQVPKTQLPEEWGSTVQLLLSYGFADPRGCEYREVELTCGTVWSNKGKLVSTHAWVLPRQDNEPAGATRFAVTWSGLVYPVSSVGALANLQMDAALQVKDLLTSRRFHGVLPEEELISYKDPHLLKGCLLLILGETAFAEKMWNGTTSHFDTRRIPNGPSEKASPYFELIQEWAWAHFDHAVCARLRGDDVLALDSLKTLVALKDSAGKEATRRGFEPPFYFLHTIEVLAEDETRRVAAPPVVRVLEPGATKIADPKARIAALIRDLEIIDETQDSQPGGVSVNRAPVVKALVMEGELAVEPLLQCLEKDQRLTRTVGFGRDFKASRYFLTVSEAAFNALQGILKSQSFGPQTERHYRLELSPRDEGRREAVAKEIREFYTRTKGVTDADRWYLILSNSQSTERQWVEAAQSITRQVPVKSAPNSKRPSPQTAAELAQDRPLQGESLRQREKPSVSELLAQRATELTKLDLNSSSRIGHLHAACTLTLCLAKWEMPAALPEIRLRVKQYSELLHDPNSHSNALSLQNSFSQLIMVAVDSGATEFLDLYAEGMKDLKPGRGGYSVTEIFRPLSRYAEHPKMAELAQTLFSEGSAWRPGRQQEGRSWESLITSPLVGVPAFRDLLKSQLDDQTVFATVTLNVTKPSIEIRFSNGSLTQSIDAVFDQNDPHLIEPKQMRQCDSIASRLSHLRGAPAYELWWPEAQRNRALIQMKSFLDQWGNAFRDQSPIGETFAGSFDNARFQIPKLARTATKSDVAAGQAIFSLAETPAEVRTVDLATYPQMAKWKTLTQFPIQTRGPKDSSTGKPTWVKSFDNVGLLWQAEEILVNGRWQRYYGFVGRHLIAKVPAEEIEFIE